MTLNLVTLQGTYLDGEGNPLSGELQFTPSAQLADTVDSQVLRQVSVTATLDDNGHFSATLYATDNANITPAGWCWILKELITGLPAYSWNFFLPYASGSTQDIWRCWCARGHQHSGRWRWRLRRGNPYRRRNGEHRRHRRQLDYGKHGLRGTRSSRRSAADHSG